MHMHRFQLIAAIVIAIITTVLIIVIPLANKDNCEDNEIENESEDIADKHIIE